jgi:hypothetical protein
MMETEARGASKAKAKRELGWTPRYPSWREASWPAYASSADDSRSVKPDRQVEPREHFGAEPVAGRTAAVGGDK